MFEDLVDGIVSSSKVLEQTFVCFPELGGYTYLVKGSLETGWRVMRRARYDDKTVRNEMMLWHPNADVDNYIQLNGGQFDKACHARPILRFARIEDATKIIHQSVKEEINSAVEKPLVSS